MKSVDLAALAFEQSSGTPVLLLREHDAPHRVVPIFVGAPEASSIAIAVSGEEPPRPLTHDLMATLVDTLDGHVERVEVTEVRDGAFLARLDLHGLTGRRHIDTRPSDAIALALRVGAPLFVSDSVLDEAGALPPETLDDESIEEVVDDFRSFLDDVDAEEFGPTGDDDSA